MMKFRKRIWALTLAVCMLLTTLPLGSAPVAAATTSLPAFNPITPEIAAEDAISTSYYTFAATSVVNGHDYLYLCLKGGKLLVYNVDTKQYVDSEYLPTSTPRSIYVDENGIVWVCGSYGLFRYDPFTGKAENISLPSGFFNIGITGTAGVTGDGNGNLYFGSFSHGCLGVYNTITKTYSKISDLLDSDAKWSGYGGLVYKNGYLYLGIDGDMNLDGTTTHAIIKYDIKNKKIVDRLDISDRLPSASQYLNCLNLVGDVLFGSIFGRLDNSIYIDITGGDGGKDGVGDTMKFITLQNLPIGHASEITEEVNGKVYFMGYYGGTSSYVEYDVATKAVTQLRRATIPVRLTCGSMVTISELPGQSIMMPVNNEDTGYIDLYFYNPSTNTDVKWDSVAGKTGGAGNSLRAPTLDPSGKYIYVGAFGNNSISKYSVEEGKVVDTFPTFSHQTDSLFFYDNVLYAGNYSAGTITKIDTETHTATPLYSLRYSVFEQCRMWATTGGGNKLFAGTTPYSGYGGMLVWYDLDKNLTYVAGGPNPEDVYYADTTGLTVNTNVQNVKYTWYNAVTGEVADFDYDNDGTDDVYLADGTRRFAGPIEGQVINNLIYKDGLLYGTTSAYGSSGNDVGSNSAVLFVYDVAAMKVIATYDLANTLTFLTRQIPVIDQLAEDPNVPGKFWGVVDDTLFTMTFDLQTKTFRVKEELSLTKDQSYSVPGGVWCHRNIVFDGPYMYVSFSRNVGTYMIVKDAPTTYRKLSTYSPNEMVLAFDGNLYWTTNSEDPGANHLHMFRIADYRYYATGTVNGVTSYYTESELPAALAIKNNVVTLNRDATVSNAVMAEGVVLDLNGHALSGVVNTAQGTVKDSLDGSGKISERPINTAPGQVALKDGNGYRVVNYTVTTDANTAVRGNDVHFWYRVAFTNADAYALAKADSSFTLGATVTVGSQTATAVFDDALVDEWAEAMPADNGTLALHVCIRNGAKVPMFLTPTVSGVACGSSIEHTGFETLVYTFTLEIDGLDQPLSGTAVLTTHTFGAV